MILSSVSFQLLRYFSRKQGTGGKKPIPLIWDFSPEPASREREPTLILCIGEDKL